jgi:excinuclease ABC subunit C
MTRSRPEKPFAGQAAPDIPDEGADLAEDLDSTLESQSEEIDFDLSALPDALKSGIEVIADFVRTLPNGPGVYRMFDTSGDVLYVGKAKNLKKRVTAYARGIAHTNRVARMISETANMEFITTATETEALLLESNLIKQLRPRYNVLLRDDKSFPYILLSRDHPAPQIAKHRGARQRKGDYFGPFASAGSVKRTIDALQKAFLLRSCSDSFYENRTRPCLLFQIKRCAGPCTGEITSEAYGELADEARDFLSGRSGTIKKELATRMQAAAGALEFETAARYRDRLAALSAISASQDINTQDVEEADVFAIDEQAGQFCVEIFFFRNHQNWGNRALFPRAHSSVPLAEVFAAVISQFYDDKPAPRLILLSRTIEDIDLLAAALSSRMGRKVEVAVPQRGEKRDLVQHTLKNAREALSRKLAETTGQEKLLASLGAAFGLATPPRRVEVYDNSHISGTNAVGGMIVAGPGGFMKTHYRTFNISSNTIAGDDFGMMREVLQRRFSRMAIEKAAAADAEPKAVDADAFPAWPDLVIVDGGKGQFQAALTTMTEAGAPDVPLVAIAKGADRNAMRETFFMADREPFKLLPRDPALYFIQRLRDEAHRFAIGTHRAKRKRELTKNPLDEIPGIGPARKRALLQHFGTVKAIKMAAFEDLSGAPGVNEATAKAVHAFFHEN